MTPAILALEEAQLSFRKIEYEYSSQRAAYGEEAAAELGVNPSQVFKTLLAELHDGEVVVSIVPVVSLLDLKALAKVTGSKKAIMAETSVAERRTGYVVGGISPFGQARLHRTFVDISACNFEEIYVSGGKRGLEVVVSPNSFEHVLGATYALLTGRII